MEPQLKKFCPETALRLVSVPSRCFEAFGLRLQLKMMHKLERRIAMQAALNPNFICRLHVASHNITLLNSLTLETFSFSPMTRHIHPLSGRELGTYLLLNQIQTPWPVQITWWWKIEEQYAAEMESEKEVFGGEHGSKRKSDLQSRVTEHNILVVSKYYAQMRIARLATLLDLPEEKVRYREFEIHKHMTYIITN